MKFRILPLTCLVLHINIVHSVFIWPNSVNIWSFFHLISLKDRPFYLVGKKKLGTEGCECTP
jgi:hypothetical protein